MKRVALTLDPKYNVQVSSGDTYEVHELVLNELTRDEMLRLVKLALPKKFEASALGESDIVVMGPSGFMFTFTVQEVNGQLVGSSEDTYFGFAYKKGRVNPIVLLSRILKSRLEKMSPIRVRETLSKTMSIHSVSEHTLDDGIYGKPSIVEDQFIITLVEQTGDPEHYIPGHRYLIKHEDGCFVFLGEWVNGDEVYTRDHCSSIAGMKKRLANFTADMNERIERCEEVKKLIESITVVPILMDNDLVNV